MKNNKEHEIKIGHFRVNTCELLKMMIEIDPKGGGGVLFVPINTFRVLIGQVAQRCTEINDPVLNRLMFDLTLYELPDPTKPEYGKLMKRLYDDEKKYLAKKNKPKSTNRRERKH